MRGKNRERAAYQFWLVFWAVLALALLGAPLLGTLVQVLRGL